MDLTSSPAEPREGTRWREGTTLAHSCQGKHTSVLCWLFVITTNRPAGVKSYTSLVHGINNHVSGHHVLNVKAHETVAACQPLCAQHAAIPKLRMLQELDLSVTSKITSETHLHLLVPIASRLLTFIANSQGQSRSKATV